MSHPFPSTQGMSVAFRSMFWTLVLLFMVIYVFAVAFKILTKGHPLEALYFGTLLESMSTLLLPGLLPDSAEAPLGMGCDAGGRAVGRRVDRGGGGGGRADERADARPRGRLHRHLGERPHGRA